MKRVAFCTLGCRVNQYETEAMTESFIKKGYDIVDFDDFSDVYVINTCTVTNVGDRKSRQMIRKAKKKNPESIIVAAGCYAQVAPEEVAQIEGVDIIVGSMDKGKVSELVEEFEREGKKINCVKNIMSSLEFEDLNIEKYQDRTRVFLKIQDGCDRFCSYCLIPYARGGVRSKEIDKIIDEVKKVAQNGYREVILSGIHVASYGKDLKGVGLLDVIEEINKIDGIKRIRIGSIDPAFFTEGVIERLSKIEKLCPHFHLSLQSGCSETLKRMNRHYTAEEYRCIVNGLRARISDVSITTDIIVGFPGETDREFEETYNFLKEIELSKMHIFKYSPRKGTRAYDFKDQVSPIIKEKRSEELLKLDADLERKFIMKHIGKTMDVLFEEIKDGKYHGYTKNYMRVEVSSDDDICGRILDVNIYDIKDNIALGRIIK